LTSCYVRRKYPATRAKEQCLSLLYRLGALLMDNMCVWSCAVAGATRTEQDHTLGDCCIIHCLFALLASNGLDDHVCLWLSNSRLHSTSSCLALAESHMHRERSLQGKGQRIGGFLRRLATASPMSIITYRPFTQTELRGKTKRWLGMIDTQGVLFLGEPGP
jgi:hypothetical protein